MATRTGRDGANVPFPAYPHEVLAVVVSVRSESGGADATSVRGDDAGRGDDAIAGRGADAIAGRGADADRSDVARRGTDSGPRAGDQRSGLSVLLWRRSRAPEAGRWALPGGGVQPTQRLREAITGHLAAKVDVSEVAWLEQVATHSKIDRDPRGRVMATGYLALVPAGSEPALPADTAWYDVAALPEIAFDHRFFIDAAVDRLRAKLSYTNIGFALAPDTFTIHQLRDIVSAALGYDVDATNLARVLTRRGTIAPTGDTSTSGPSGGRPAAVYRFCSRELTVTDPFATLRPPPRG